MYKYIQYSTSEDCDSYLDTPGMVSILSICSSHCVEFPHLTHTYTQHFFPTGREKYFVKAGKIATGITTELAVFITGTAYI